MMHPYHRNVLILLIALLALPAGARAQEHESEGAMNPIHHVTDGYVLDFAPFGEVELPRIFVVRRADGGLGVDVYGSTHAACASGEYVPATGETPEAAGMEEEGAEEHAEAEEHAGAEGAEAECLEAETLVPARGKLIADLSISRHLVFAWVGALIVLLIFVSLARRYERGIGRDTAPRGAFQNLFETLIVFVRDDIARPNLGDKYRRYLPYLLTIFFFILTCNLLGLVPFGATATSNIAITGVLATFTFILTQLGGTKDYWKHIFWPPGVPTLVKPILIPVEILGLFTKPFALAIRLFANMTAGHLVILSLIGLIFTFGSLFGAGAGYGVAPVSVAFSLFIYLLELLVAFIQAYIFTMLSALFIGMAVEEHHHEGHEDYGLQPIANLEHSTPILVGQDGDQAHTAPVAEPAPAH